MSKILYVNIVLLLSLIGLLIFFIISNFLTSPKQEWAIYKNDDAGYSVEYLSKGGFIEEQKGALLAGFRLMDREEAIVTSFAYEVEKGSNVTRRVADIHCSITGHLYEEGKDIDLGINLVALSNEMSLKEYAQTLYDNKLKHSLKRNQVDVAVPIKSIQIGANNTFAGRLAFPFILAESSINRSLDRDVIGYIVTENPKGQKCVISYPIYDIGISEYPEMANIIQHWLNSFSWTD